MQAQCTPLSHSQPPAQCTPLSHSQPPSQCTPLSQSQPPAQCTPLSQSQPPAQCTPLSHSQPPALCTAAPVSTFQPPEASSRSVNSRQRTLPSTAINKKALKTVKAVTEANIHLTNKTGKMTTFAVVLAREAIFGDEVMAQCTAKGSGEKPGLPHNELMELKDAVYQAYPEFWNSGHLFEAQWIKCTDAISQACKRARYKLKK